MTAEVGCCPHGCKHKLAYGPTASSAEREWLTRASASGWSLPGLRARACARDFLYTPSYDCERQGPFASRRQPTSCRLGSGCWQVPAPSVHQQAARAKRAGHQQHSRVDERRSCGDAAGRARPALAPYSQPPAARPRSACPTNDEPSPLSTPRARPARARAGLVAPGLGAHRARSVGLRHSSGLRPPNPARRAAVARLG